MKSSRFLLALAGSTLLLIGAANAQYTTSFDPPTYSNLFTLSGQNGWDTNDANQTDAVNVVLGYSGFRPFPLPADYWAVLGGLAVDSGYEPAVVTTDLWRPFTLSTPNDAQFSTTMAITPSVVSAPAQDTFQWIFRRADNSPIVSIDFVPYDDAFDDSFQVRWTDSSGQTSTGLGGYYSSKMDMVALLTGLGTATPHLKVTLDPAGVDPLMVVIDTDIAAWTLGGIEQVAASWTLADTAYDGINGVYTNYGANALIFNNYTVVPVPEPSAVVMLGLIGMGIAWLRFGKRSEVA